MARILFEIKVLPETKADLYKLRSLKKYTSWDDVFKPLFGTHKRLHKKVTDWKLPRSDALRIENSDILNKNKTYVLRYSDTWHCQPSGDI